MQPVCLITPPSPFLLDARVFVSLGILRVAASLEANGVPVEHLDLSGIDNAAEAVRDHAARSEATVYGLTATTPQMPAAMEIARTLRTVRPDARLILGGPHVTLVNAARKRETTPGRASAAFGVLWEAFDCLVCGDGEDAVLTAIWHHAPKVIDADDPQSALFLTNARYNELPFPSRHLVDMDSYHYWIEGRRATSAIWQLGCPYQCAFCGGRNSPMLRRIRTRTTESVIAEMRHLYTAHGYTAVMAYDDELNVNPNCVELFHAIADLGDELGIEWRLRGFIKSNLFTEAQAAAMRRAGFRWILVGFESGSPRILENIKKKATREQNTRCLEIARAHDLGVKALMSIGHAGESADTIAETKAWLLENRPDDFDATVITVYPGTPYFDDALETAPGVWTYTAKNGDRLHSVETDFTREASYYKGRPGEYTSFVYTDHLRAEEIVRLRDDMEGAVRRELGIPYPASGAARAYEHSVGMGLPDYILRETAAREAASDDRRGETRQPMAHPIQTG